MVRAIFAGCDEIAIGIIVAARQLGIQVPSELSVIGIDGHDLAPTFGLTTVEQNPAAQGAAVASMVLTRLADTAWTDAAVQGEGPHTTLPIRLAMRRSTRAPKSS